MVRHINCYWAVYWLVKGHWPGSQKVWALGSGPGWLMLQSATSGWEQSLRHVLETHTACSHPDSCTSLTSRRDSLPFNKRSSWVCLVNMRCMAYVPPSPPLIVSPGRKASQSSQTLGSHFFMTPQGRIRFLKDHPWALTIPASNLRSQNQTVLGKGVPASLLMISITPLLPTHCALKCLIFLLLLP